jgi:membrane protein DedA with SNARE-associated domain
MQALLNWLETLAQQTSLEIFAVIASFLEEVIAPIPSPFVMTTTAVIAQAQQYSYLQLFGILVIASLGKTIAAVLFYYIVDKAEDVLVGKYGKFFGVSHQSIEKIGQILTNSWYDDVLLLIARSLPFVPSSLVSIVAGAIKYDMKSYIIMTFLGTIVRSAFYLWVGYIGWDAANAVWRSIQGHPAFITLAVVGVVILLYILMKIKDLIWDAVFERATKNTK